jgi:hypothetical protein
MMCDIGIELRLAANRDKIGLPVLKDGLGLLRLENYADAHRGDVHFFASPLRKGNLKAEAAGDLSCRGRHRRCRPRSSRSHPAKIAKPDKQVIVVHGDGSFGMNAMELDTAMRHKIPVLVVISLNGGWAHSAIGL